MFRVVGVPLMVLLLLLHLQSPFVALMCMHICFILFFSLTLLQSLQWKIFTKPLNRFEVQMNKWNRERGGWGVGGYGVLKLNPQQVITYAEDDAIFQKRPLMTWSIVIWQECGESSLVWPNVLSPLMLSQCTGITTFNTRRSTFFTSRWDLRAPVCNSSVDYWQTYRWTKCFHI